MRGYYILILLISAISIPKVQDQKCSAIPPTLRRDCGALAVDSDGLVTKISCLAQSCCWDTTSELSAWCYYVDNPDDNLRAYLGAPMSDKGPLVVHQPSEDFKPDGAVPTTTPRKIGHPTVQTGIFGSMFGAVNQAENSKPRQSQLGGQIFL
jgi:hypothetical protein